MQCPLSNAKCNVSVVANKTEYIWYNEGCNKLQLVNSILQVKYPLLGTLAHFMRQVSASLF